MKNARGLRTVCPAGLLAALLVAGAAPWAAPAAAQDLAVRGATILTMAGEGTIEDGTVLVLDGRIADVGPSAQVQVPEGIRVVDGAGRFVIPGIVDAHSHMAMDGARNERVDVVTPEVKVRVKQDTLDIFPALAGGVTTVHIMHGSHNVIGGQGKVAKLRWGRSMEEMKVDDGPGLVKFALGENPMRSNTAPPLPTRYPVSRRGVENVIRDAFTRARAYQAEWEAYERRAQNDGDAVPPRRDLRLEALVDILNQDIWVHAHSYRYDEILMLVRLAEEFGFRIAAFQHALEAYKVANELAESGAGASLFADTWGGFGKVEVQDSNPYATGILVARGVNVSINSDSEERIRRLFQEAGMLTKYGLTEEEALATITLNPAMQIGLDHRIGSIEVGKDGDLAVFNGHPFAPGSRVEMTVIEGEVYFDWSEAPTLERLLERERAEMEEDR